MKDNLLEIIGQQLLAADNVVIMPHINADGDALGASFALGLALRSLGKDVTVLLEEEVSSTLAFLPGQELIGQMPDRTFHTAINLDNGDLVRLGKRQPYFYGAQVRLSIDHHATNKVEAHYSLVDTSASATGEIIYDLITQFLKLPLDKDTALCLYTAILTDTGGFRYSNTTPKTLEVAAELVKLGIDFIMVVKNVFDRISHTKLYLMKQTMNSLRLLAEGKLAITYITFEDEGRCQAQSSDFEGLVNIGRSLEGVEVCAFLREDPKGHFRGNLRSNEYVDVAKAAESFGGGGHKRAAGFNAEGDLEEVIEKLTGVILPHLDQASTDR